MQAHTHIANTGSMLFCPHRHCHQIPALRSCEEYGARLISCEADTDSVANHQKEWLKGKADHVHLVVRYPPTLSIPDLVGHLKRRGRNLL